MVKVTSLHIEAENALGFSFGIRAQTEMKIRCVKGTHFLKVEYVDTRFSMAKLAIIRRQV